MLSDAEFARTMMIAILVTAFFVPRISALTALRLPEPGGSCTVSTAQTRSRGAHNKTRSLKVRRSFCGDPSQAQRRIESNEQSQAATSVTLAEFCVYCIAQFAYSSTLRELLFDQLPQRSFQSYVASVTVVIIACLLVPTRQAVTGGNLPKPWNLPLNNGYVERNFLLVSDPKWPIMAANAGRWWTCLTHMFYHIDDNHLFCNLMGLVGISYFVYLRFGVCGFFFIYLGGGVFAAYNDGRAQRDRLKYGLHKQILIEQLKARLIHSKCWAKFILLVSLFSVWCKAPMIIAITLAAKCAPQDVRHLANTWPWCNFKATASLGASAGVFALDGAFVCIIAEVLTNHVRSEGRQVQYFAAEFMVLGGIYSVVKVMVLSYLLLERLSAIHLEANAFHAVQCSECHAVDNVAHIYGFVFGILTAVFFVAFLDEKSAYCSSA